MGWVAKVWPPHRLVPCDCPILDRPNSMSHMRYGPDEKKWTMGGDTLGGVDRPPTMECH